MRNPNRESNVDANLNRMAFYLMISDPRKDKMRHAGESSEPARARVTRSSDELVALEFLKSAHCIAI